MISAIAHRLWAWLPEVSTGLQFATAVLGLCTAIGTIRRLRHRCRQVEPVGAGTPSAADHVRPRPSRRTPRR